MIPFLIAAATFVAIQAVLALGLNVQWGLAGLLDLAFIAFMAIGAYITAVLISPPANPPSVEYVLGFSWPLPLALVGGIVVATLAALLVGALALRNLRADYFAVVTLVIAEALQQIIGQFRPLFNGSAGLVNIPQPFDPGDYDTYTVLFLVMCVVSLAVVFVIVEKLRLSTFGRALRAVREDEVSAATFGRNPYLLKLKAFVIGGAIAGFAGGLLGLYVSAFAPAGWNVSETLLVLVCLFVGGTANNWGALVGTALVIGLLGQLPTLVPSLTDNPNFIPDMRFMFIGLLIVVFLRWWPAGLVPERFSWISRMPVSQRVAEK
jgi:branched-chain amino acid transport system permease protein